MSLSRVSSIDGMQMGRDGTRESMSRRRMSFNPVSDWIPESAKRPSVVPTYTREDVSKGKRIGELVLKIQPPVASKQALTRRSAGDCRGHLLPLRRWNRLRLRRYQTRPHSTRSV
jgi:hypothetical protein